MHHIAVLFWFFFGCIVHECIFIEDNSQKIHHWNIVCFLLYLFHKQNKQYFWPIQVLFSHSYISYYLINQLKYILLARQNPKFVYFNELNASNHQSLHDIVVVLSFYEFLKDGKEKVVIYRSLRLLRIL